MKFKRVADGEYRNEDGRVIIRREEDFQSRGRGARRSMTKVHVWQAYIDGKPFGFSWDTLKDAREMAERQLLEDSRFKVHL